MKKRLSLLFFLFFLFMVTGCNCGSSERTLMLEPLTLSLTKLYPKRVFIIEFESVTSKELMKQLKKYEANVKFVFKSTDKKAYEASLVRITLDTVEICLKAKCPDLKQTQSLHLQPGYEGSLALSLSGKETGKQLWKVGLKLELLKGSPVTGQLTVDFLTQYEKEADRKEIKEFLWRTYFHEFPYDPD